MFDKKNRKNIIFLLISLIVLVLFLGYLQYCKLNRENLNRKGDNNLGVIRLDKAYKEKIPLVKLSSIARSVSYIELEDKEDCLLLHPAVRGVTDSAIIIEDNSSCIYQFNKSGKLIWKIDKKGKGPGEYVRIYDVCLDDKNDILYVLDNNQRKIIKYGFLLGEYINEIKIPLSSGSFALYNQGFVLWNPPWSFVNQNKCYYLTFIDKEGRILHQIERYENDNNYRGGLLTSAIFYELDEKIYIKDTYNDTVYRIASDYDLITHAIISSGKYTITRKISEDVFLREKYKNDYISQLVFLESERYIFFSFYIGKYYLT